VEIEIAVKGDELIYQDRNTASSSVLEPELKTEEMRKEFQEESKDGDLIVETAPKN